MIYQPLFSLPDQKTVISDKNETNNSEIESYSGSVNYSSDNILNNSIEYAIENNSFEAEKYNDIKSKEFNKNTFCNESFDCEFEESDISQELKSLFKNISLYPEASNIKQKTDDKKYSNSNHLLPSTRETSKKTETNKSSFNIMESKNDSKLNTKNFDSSNLINSNNYFLSNKNINNDIENFNYSDIISFDNVSESNSDFKNNNNLLNTDNNADQDNNKYKISVDNNKLNLAFSNNNLASFKEKLFEITKTKETLEFNMSDYICNLIRTKDGCNLLTNILNSNEIKESAKIILFNVSFLLYNIIYFDNYR